MDDLERAESAFEDASLAARLQQYVGQASFVEPEQPDLTPLAQELLADVSLLSATWSWLTSGQAADTWRLGTKLGELDEAGSLADVLTARTNRGPDLRLTSGYVFACTKKVGIAWFDQWIGEHMQRDPEDVHLLFEIATRAPRSRERRSVCRIEAAADLNECLKAAQVAFLAIGAQLTHRLIPPHSGAERAPPIAGRLESGFALSHLRLHDGSGPRARLELCAARLRGRRGSTSFH